MASIFKEQNRTEWQSLNYLKFKKKKKKEKKVKQFQDRLLCFLKC